MKRIIGILLIGFLLFLACGQDKNRVEYTKDSKEYALFETLSDSLGYQILDPETSIPLIESDKFTVETADILPHLYQKLMPSASTLDQIPKEQLFQLINFAADQEGKRQLLLAAAKGKHFRVSEDSLNVQMERLYASSGSEETFTNQITSQGFTLDYVKQDVERNLLINEYINDYLYNNIPVEAEILQSEYEKDKLATVRHILLLTQGKSDAEKRIIRRKAESILTRAKAGEDFSELAKAFSEDPGSSDKGGLYEDFPKGYMVKPFEDASFTVPVGEISDIVETRYGFHIIKVIDRKKETRPFDEVKKKIHIQIAMQQNPGYFPVLIDSLKARYHYEIVMPDSI